MRSSPCRSPSSCCWYHGTQTPNMQSGTTAKQEQGRLQQKQCHPLHGVAKAHRAAGVMLCASSCLHAFVMLFTIFLASHYELRPNRLCAPAA